MHAFHGLMESWTDVYGFFYILGIGGAAAIVVADGARRKTALLPLLTVVGWAVAGGIIGSKLLVIPLEHWAPAISEGSIPGTTAKTYLGGVLGGTLAVLAVRQLIGFRVPVADHFALALPVGLAIGRIGCFIGGCCFGSASTLPWAMTYPAHTHPHGEQVAAGLIDSAAPLTAAVHPTQLYEIVFLVALSLVLIRNRSRFRRPGSLFMLSAGSYGAFRFLEEFVRHGSTTYAGLNLAQWGLLLAVPSLFIVLWHRERKTRPVPASKSTTNETANRFVAAGVLGLAGLGLAARTWFTELEMTAWAMACVPAFLCAATVAARAVAARLNYKPGTAVAAAAMLAAPALFSPAQIGPKHKKGETLWQFDISGTAGQWEYETCDDNYLDRYAAAGLGASSRYFFEDWLSGEIGLKAYWGRIWREVGPGDGDHDSEPSSAMDFEGGSAPWQYLMVGPFAELDFYYASIGGGIYAVLSDTRNNAFIPGFMVRLGPEDILFAEARMLHGDYPAYPLPIMELYGGFGVGELGIMRAGLSPIAGILLSPTFYIPTEGAKVLFSPRAAFGGEGLDHRDTFYFGATISIEMKAD